MAPAAVTVRVGAVDIGTNTVRLLVVELAADGSPRPAERRSVVTGLGRGVDATGRIGTEAMAATRAVLAEYRALAARHEVDVLGAVATSATRDAANAADVLAVAADALGVVPVVVAGEREAALSFRGATAGMAGAGATLVIDPGGGSTEFILGRNEPDYAVSIDLGSVRLTERCVPTRPAPLVELAAAQAEAARLFAAVELPRPADVVVGVGGTFTALGAIALDLDRSDPDRVHGTVVTVDRFDELTVWLAGLTLGETQEIPSLDPARAPVLLGGAIVVGAALRAVGAAAATISENDLLLGLALELGAGPDRARAQT